MLKKVLLIVLAMFVVTGIIFANTIYFKGDHFGKHKNTTNIGTDNPTAVTGVNGENDEGPYMSKSDAHNPTGVTSVNGVTGENDKGPNMSEPAKKIVGESESGKKVAKKIKESEEGIAQDSEAPELTEEQKKEIMKEKEEKKQKTLGKIKENTQKNLAKEMVKKIKECASPEQRKEIMEKISELEAKKAEQKDTDEIEKTIAVLKQKLSKISKCVVATTQEKKEKWAEIKKKQKCEQLEMVKKKLEDYDKLASKPIEDLKKQGFSIDEIENIKKSLMKSKNKLEMACNGGDVKLNTGDEEYPVIGDVGEYYAEKVKDISEMTDVDTQIEALKKLKKEVNKKIAYLIKEKQKINSKEFGGDDVTIAPNKIIVGDENINTVDKEINVEDAGYNLKNDGNFVEMDKNGFIVKSNIPLKLKEKELMFEDKNIKLPWTLKNVAPKAVELIDDNGPKYRMKKKIMRKLFGFIPVNTEDKLEVDAITWKVNKIEKPWWNFLSSGDTAIDEGQELLE